MKYPLISRHKLIFVIILVILLMAPFLNKAFHIDDTVILYAARQDGGTVNWLGRAQKIRELSDSPLISRYIAFIISLTGESEFWLHTFFLIFPTIAVLSMYFLSKYFTNRPFISTLLLISTPAFFVSATNIMPDFALLAFYLAAVCTFVYGIEKQNKLMLIASGFIAGPASLTKYTGLTVLPLFFFYAILKRKLSKGLLAVCIAFAVLGIWYLRDFILFGKIQIAEGLWQFKPTFFLITASLLGSLTYTTNVTVFPLLFLVLLEKKRDWFIYFFLIWLSAIMCFNWFLKSKYTAPQIFLSAFLISTPLVTLRKFICADSIFLLIWFCGIFFHNVFILSWYAAPRYILILIPPLILMLMKRYDIILSHRKCGIIRHILYLGIALNLVFSVLVASADYVYADTYRKFTRTYAKYLKEKGAKIWFRGHWGFQYYMEKEGFTYLGLDDTLGKGEIVIVPSVCDHETFSRDLKGKLKFVGSVKYETIYPFRTISSQDRINFYSYLMGPLPYGISREPLEVFQIWQVE